LQELTLNLFIIDLMRYLSLEQTMMIFYFALFLEILLSQFKKFLLVLVFLI